MIKFNTHRRPYLAELALGIKRVPDSDYLDPATHAQVYDVLYGYATISHHKRREDGTYSDEDALDIMRNCEKYNEPMAQDLNWIVTKFEAPITEVTQYKTGQKRIGKGFQASHIITPTFKDFGGGVKVFNDMPSVFARFSGAANATVILIGDDKSSPKDAVNIDKHHKAFTGSETLPYEKKYHDTIEKRNYASFSVYSNFASNWGQGSKRLNELLLGGGVKKEGGNWVIDNKRLEEQPAIKRCKVKIGNVTYTGIEAAIKLLDLERASFIQDLKDMVGDNVKPASYFTNATVHPLITHMRNSSIGIYNGLCATIVGYQTATPNNKEMFRRQLVNLLHSSPLFSLPRDTFIRSFNTKKETEMGTQLDLTCLLYGKITIGVLVAAINMTNKKTSGDIREHTENSYERTLAEAGVEFDLDETSDIQLYNRSKVISIPGLDTDLLVKKGHLTKEDIRRLDEGVKQGKTVTAADLDTKLTVNDATKQKLSDDFIKHAPMVEIK